MTWILILWINPGWQMNATGSAGGGITTAVMADKAACVAAGQFARKQFNEIGFVCVPSSTEAGK